MTDACLFCHDTISDFGLGWYKHVAEEPTCRALWKDWVEHVWEDHPEG